MEQNLEQYRIFCAVAQEASFSAAARKLYISQPAVSQSIAALESALKTPLFLRSSKGVQLTPEGKILYDYAQKALGLLRAGEEKLAQCTRLQIGEVKIAAADTIAAHYLLPYLEQFHHEYPAIRLQVINRTSDESVALLKAGGADLAFINLPYEDSALICTPCMEVQDIFVVGRRYLRLAFSPISPAQLALQPLILLEQKSNSRRFVDRYFSDYGIVPNPEIELCSHDLLLEFAKIGLGVACVVREFAQEIMTQGDLFSLMLVPPLPRRAIGVCRLAGMAPSAAAGAFLNLLNTSPKWAEKSF